MNKSSLSNEIIMAISRMVDDPQVATREPSYGRPVPLTLTKSRGKILCRRYGNYFGVSII